VCVCVNCSGLQNGKSAQKDGDGDSSNDEDDDDNEDTDGSVDADSSDDNSDVEERATKRRKMVNIHVIALPVA
jgi:hypothetical protein